MPLTIFHLLFSSLFLSLPCIIFAQDTAVGDELPLSCTFSCPEANAASLPLVNRPHAIGYESFYSVFECIYATPNSQSSENKCSYYKVQAPTWIHVLDGSQRHLQTSGLQALDSEGDNCLPNAVPCSGRENSKPPMFSGESKEEIAPWVEGGRSLLYLKEHQP
ncbi:hypothetical protein BDZ97DRAFT_1757015 [Flammula alnicola]|nr:hypothetical protein BDZ97DRAFT_1757015 [Flammula alnicola]